MNWFSKRRAGKKAVGELLRKANALVAMNECTKEIEEKRAKYASLDCPVMGSKCTLEQCVFWHQGYRLFERYDSEFAYGVTVECKLETEKWRLTNEAT